MIFKIKFTNQLINKSLWLAINAFLFEGQLLGTALLPNIIHNGSQSCQINK